MFGHTIVEINPTTKASHDQTPLFRILHHNRTTLFVVVSNSKLLNVLLGLELVDLVYFKLNGKTMTVPPKPSCNVMARLVSISTTVSVNMRKLPCYNILDCSSQDVPIV